MSEAAESVAGNTGAKKSTGVKKNTVSGRRIKALESIVFRWYCSCLCT